MRVYMHVYDVTLSGVCMPCYDACLIASYELTQIDLPVETEAPASESQREAATKDVETAMKKLEEERSSIRINDGDYQVQVHIIEVRDLKGEDKEGTSDPVVFVEVCNKKQSTAVKKSTQNCVFDEVLFFPLPKSTRAALEKAVIKV